MWKSSYNKYINFFKIIYAFSLTDFFRMKRVNTAVSRAVKTARTRQKSEHQTASPVVCKILYRKDIHNEKNTLLSCLQH